MEGEGSCTAQYLPNTSCLIPMLLLQVLNEKPTKGKVKIIPVHRMKTREREETQRHSY